MADYLGKEVVFGVRPEDIHDRQYAPPGITAAPLTAKVDVTELINEISVYLLTGQKSFILVITKVRPLRQVGKGV